MTRAIPTKHSMFFTRDGVAVDMYAQILGPMRYSGYLTDRRGDVWVCQWIFPTAEQFFTVSEHLWRTNKGEEVLPINIDYSKLERRTPRDFS